MSFTLEELISGYDAHVDLIPEAVTPEEAFHSACTAQTLRIAAMMLAGDLSGLPVTE